jgi:hypothetical protein
MGVDWKWFLPTVPPRDLDDESMYRWNFAVFVNLAIIGGATFVNMALIWGIIPVVFGGFATAASMNDTNKSIMMLQQTLDIARKESASSKNEIQATIIGQNIYNLRIMQCQALKAHNGTAVESMESQIKQKKAEFRNAAGYEYETSSCENLGIMP